MQFPVALHTDDGVCHGVTVPDLPGRFSAGDTLEEALDAVLEAIDLHVQGLLEDGHQLPVVQALAVHQAHPGFAEAVWAMVDAAVERQPGSGTSPLVPTASAQIHDDTA